MGARSSARIALRVLSALAILVVFLLTSLGSLAQEDELITVILGRPSDGDSVDPHNVNSQENFQNCSPVYEFLVFPGPSGTRIPLLTYDWQHNEDYTEWTVKVMEGVTFHDGTPLNAEAVRVNFERILNAYNTVAEYANYADENTCQVVDEYTVKFVFNSSNQQFMNSDGSAIGLVCPGAIAEHSTADDPYADEWFSENTCGTGPFRLVSWERGKQLVFEKVPEYWGGPGEGEHMYRDPYIDRVIQLVIPDNTVRSFALVRGDIDIAEGLTADQCAALRVTPGFKVMSAPQPWLVYIGFDVNVPPFDDEKVRQAIAYAINYDEIIQGPERGFAERQYSMSNKGFLGHDPSALVQYDYDPVKAEALLKASGYPDGFSTTLTYSTERRAEYEEEGLLIQAYLGAIGIDVTLRNVAFSTQNAMTRAAYEGMVLQAFKGSGIDPDETFGWRISPSRKEQEWAFGWDVTHWEDPIAFNTALGAEAEDREERAALYLELDKAISEQAIAIPLFSYGSLLAMADYMGDVWYNSEYQYNWWEMKKGGND
jgi:peptide/nickel transport system substrate-binding protein